MGWVNVFLDARFQRRLLHRRHLTWINWKINGKTKNRTVGRTLRAGVLIYLSFSLCHLHFLRFARKEYFYLRQFLKFGFVLLLKYEIYCDECWNFEYYGENITKVSILSTCNNYTFLGVTDKWKILNSHRSFVEKRVCRVTWAFFNLLWCTDFWEMSVKHAFHILTISKYLNWWVSSGVSHLLQNMLSARLWYRIGLTVWTLIAKCAQ